MTKTIELNADEEKLLHEAAQRRGITPEDYLREAWRELAELDAAEDSEDARRVLAHSDPAKRCTLADLRRIQSPRFA